MEKKEKLIIIGRNIKTARLKKGITQEELANIIDGSISFISEIETGSAGPSLSKIIKIAKALDTTVDCLLGEIQNTINDEYFLIAKSLLADCSEKECKFLLNTIEQIKKVHREIYRDGTSESSVI